MSRWRIGTLAVLVLWPLLVVCVQVHIPVENESGSSKFAGNNQDAVDVTIEKGAVSDRQTASDFPGAPVEATADAGGGTTATAATQSEGGAPEGNDTHTVTLGAPISLPVPSTGIHTHELVLFNDSSVAEVFRIFLAAAFFGTIPGVSADVTATLIAPDGTRTPVPLNQLTDLPVDPNGPSGGDWVLEVTSTISIPGGSGPGATGTTVRWLVQAPGAPPPGPNGFCTSSSDCAPDEECVSFGCGKPCPDDAACGTGETCADGYCHQGCTQSSECGPSEVCKKEGFCANRSCGFSPDCPRGHVCVFNQCFETGPGQPCEDTVQCPEGLECIQSGFALVCAQCSDTMPCANGEPCVDGLCARTSPCQTVLDCSPGAQCDAATDVCQECSDTNPPSPGMMCLAGQAVQCLSRDDCAEGEVCDDGRCEVTVPCLSAGDCPAGTSCCSPLGEVDVLLEGEASYCAGRCPWRCQGDDDCPGRICAHGWCIEDSCGDGIVDPGEDCDGADLAGADCRALGFLGGSLVCRADCTFDPSGCLPPVCGDQQAQGFEACDGADLGAESCFSFNGSDGGTTACASDCRTVDFTPCTCGGTSCNPGEFCLDGLCLFEGARCGDGFRTSDEECDGADVSGVQCQDRGFSSGTGVCRKDCTLDTTPCDCNGNRCGESEVCKRGECSPEQLCGNGIVEEGEQCDGPLDCSEITQFGFRPGPATCRPDCTLDLSTCVCGAGTCAGPNDSCRFGICQVATCGNGVAEELEICDGGDLHGRGCGDLGFTGGTLACGADCQGFGTSGCTCGGAACGPAEICSEGACTCVPGANRCNGTAVETCSAVETFELEIQCADGCLEGSCVAIPEVEPNDTGAAPQDLGTLSADTQTIIAASVGLSADEDWYTFQVATGTPGTDPLHATIETDESFDTEIWLYSAGDPTFTSPLERDNDSGNGLGSQIEFDLGPGTYFVRVGAFSGSTTGDYELTIDLEDRICSPGERGCNGDVLTVCSADGTDLDPFAICVDGCDAGGLGCATRPEFEPNGTPQTGDDLGELDDAALSIDALGATGDEDWYKFTIDGTADLTVLTNPPEPVDLSVAGDTGLTSLGQDPSGSLDVILDTGTYALQVTPNAPYTLSIEVVDLVCAPFAERCEDGDLQECNADGTAFEEVISCAHGCDDLGEACEFPFEVEDNGDRTRANDLGTIVVDREEGRSGNLPNGLDQDWYTFTVTEPNFLNLETRPRDPNNVDTELLLFDGGGNLLARDDDSGEGGYSRIFTSFLPAGSYFLLVGPGADDPSGSYELVIDQVSEVPDGAVASFELFDTGGVSFVDEANEGLGTAGISFDEAIPATGTNRFVGSANASAPAGTLGQASADLQFFVNEPVGDSVQGTSQAVARRSFLVTSTDPAATEATVDLATGFEVVLDAPGAGVPAGGSISTVFFVSQIGSDGVATRVQLDGVQMTGTAVVRHPGGGCPGAGTFVTPPRADASRSGTDASGSCTFPITVPVGEPVQLEWAVIGRVQGVSGGSPPETAEVRFPAPFTVDVATSDPTLQIQLLDP